MSQPCGRCGMRGVHTSFDECIDALRDRIGDLEIAIDTEKASASTGATGNRGGYRKRSDLRMLTLDGERVNLTEASRRLGLSPAALHFRIVNRLHTKDYGCVDLRAIGADQLLRAPRLAS